MKKKMYINSMGYYKHIITPNYHNYCRDVTSVDFRVKEVRNRKKNFGNWNIQMMKFHCSQPYVNYRHFY